MVNPQRTKNWRVRIQRPLRGSEWEVLGHYRWRWLATLAAHRNLGPLDAAVVEHRREAA